MPCKTKYQIFGSAIFLVLLLSSIVYYKYTVDSIISGSAIRKASLFSTFLDKPDTGKTDSHSIIKSRYPIQDTDIQEKEYRSRIMRYKDVCTLRKQELRGVETVFFYKNRATNRSIGHCSIPKTGVTFWHRIFQFLNGVNHTHVSSPMALTRFQMYFDPRLKSREVRYDDAQMKDGALFIFVRDPYARLMSAYIDKFILPQFLTLDSYGKIFTASRDRNTCVEDVTFSAFVKKIVLSSSFNYHWAPMYKVCDPCKLFPNFIGKQESFSKDMKYILNKVGLQHLLSEYSHKTYVGDQIKQMVDFAYSFRDSDQYLRKCFNNTDIASRLWRAFQMNGYLFSSTMFPKTQMASLLKTEQNTTGVIDIVTKAIVKENARVGISRDQHSKQKRDMLVQEFATLSKDAMERLAEMYDVDFQMFGYDKYPKYLFQWRYLKE